jgi:uncharacterized iron-regulated membrane protein
VFASSGKGLALGHRVKRWLYIIHRWIGIASCLLFAIWFVSGLVMIYVPFPSLTAEERVAGLQSIDWSRVDVQPAAALAAAGITLSKGMSLEMRDRLPVWRIDPWDRPQQIIAASSGAMVKPVNVAMARRVVTDFGHAPVSAVELLSRDQWTVAGGFNRYRPLWKVELADRAGTVLYVSSVSGTVVQNTDRQERFWNWLGSVPHWIYPTVLRQDGPAWRQVVLWVSGPCIAAAVTGMWIGILRTRMGRRRFRGGRMTPYHGWMLWHHIAGLVGGVALLAWIFSGWLSVDPGRLFDSPGIGDAERTAYAGAGTAPYLDIARLTTIAPGAKLLKLSWAAGRSYIVIERPNRPALTLDPSTYAQMKVAEPIIMAAAAKLVPRARIREVERLTAPDAYWYDVGSLPKLPILRVEYDDPAGTWVHIDPATGAILGEIDGRGRVYRWLFDLLHKWDLNGLTLNRPAWDALLWGLSILGLITSISGIWIGWIRLTQPRVASRRRRRVR